MGYGLLDSDKRYYNITALETAIWNLTHIFLRKCAVLFPPGGSTFGNVPWTLFPNDHSQPSETTICRSLNRTKRTATVSGSAKNIPEEAARVNLIIFNIAHNKTKLPSHTCDDTPQKTFSFPRHPFQCVRGPVFEDNICTIRSDGVCHVSSPKRNLYLTIIIIVMMVHKVSKCICLHWVVPLQDLIHHRKDCH